MEFEKLASIIAQVLSLDPKEITMETAFVDDLGADSLDLFQIIMGIEEAFDIEVPESAAEQKELKAKQQLVSESINDQNAPVETDIQTDDTNDETPERKRERSELMSMMQVYKTNPDGSRARRRMICRVERVFDAVSVRH